MAENIRTALKADYLKRFSCIGPPCEDNCCVGWDVDFDRASYNKYRSVSSGELGALFKGSVRKNPHCFSDDVDYAVVKLKKGKVCPFLREDRLCTIQAELGEGWLSNVCFTYPRYTNLVDGVFEHSATVSCPEAARLILLEGQCIAFVPEQEPSDTRTILTYQVDTGDGRHPLRVRLLKELRAFSVSVISDRRITIEERLRQLGCFYKDFSGPRGPRSLAEGKRFISGWKPEEKPKLRADQADRIAQILFLDEIAGGLKLFSEVDSRRYIAYVKEFIHGLGLEKSRASQGSAQSLEQAHGKYMENFMAENSAIFENYLINFVYKELFPATEGETAFDAYMMLTIRFVFIKLHLTGIAANREMMTPELAVDFIQAFSKAVEHHKTYLETMAEHLISGGHNSMKTVEMLLRG